MVLPQLPGSEQLNARTYDPYKEKMHRHNSVKIKDIILKQQWGELGAIGHRLRDRVLAVHNETHKLLGPGTGVFGPPPPHAIYHPPTHTTSTDTGAESQGA
jgi:hypothetical protein